MILSERYLVRYPFSFKMREFLFVSPILRQADLYRHGVPDGFINFRRSFRD